MSSAPSRRALVALTVLSVVACVRVALTWTEFSATMDEGRHIAAAVETYQTGRFTVFFTSPLPRYALGLLPYLAGARFPGPEDAKVLERYREVTRGDRESAIGKFVLEESPDYWRTLSLARAGTLVFLLLLVAFVFRWSALLYGEAAGLLAVAVVTLSPNILGNAGLATTDLAVTATMFACAYLSWRWSLDPARWKLCLAAGVAYGAAIASKPPAMTFLALILILFFVLAHRKLLALRSTWTLDLVKAILGRALAFGAAAFLVLWATYQFSFHPIVEQMGKPLTAIDTVVPPGTALNRTLHQLSETLPIPMPAFFHGLWALWGQLARSWPGYIFGKMHPDGVWWYYPAALALKLTLPFLAGILLGIASLLAHRKTAAARASLYPAVAAGAILAGLMLDNVNIGIRHALPLVPFLALLASAFAATGFWPDHRRRRAIVSVGLALVLWHGAESVIAHPDYFAYFNEIARGRESEYLLDSNLDWGQDMARLGRYVQAHDIDEITLSVFGARYSTSPAALGMPNAHLIDPDERPTGWLAVSANHLAGIGLRGANYEKLDRFRWLDGIEPRARIGKSIWIWYLPPPEP